MTVSTERATTGPTDVNVTFVLPAHNEVSLLGSTITNLVTGAGSRGLDFEVVVVENGSTDGTLRLARLLAAQIDTVRVLTLPRGNYGAALATGYRAARGSIVVQFDVDYYDLAFLDRALALIDDGAAIVVASKRARGSSDRRPIIRRFLTFGFTTLLRLTVALPVTDAHGMKALRKDVCDAIVAQCKVRANLYDVELLVRAGRAGLSIKELPATVVERRPPRSSVGRRAVGALGETARLKLALVREDRRRRGTSPPQPKR